MALKEEIEMKISSVLSCLYFMVQQGSLLISTTWGENVDCDLDHFEDDSTAYTTGQTVDNALSAFNFKTMQKETKKSFIGPLMESLGYST